MLTDNVSCPKCGARKKQPCVYIKPNAPVGTAAYVSQLAIAGNPTKRPHNERLHKAHIRERLERRKELPKECALTPNRDAILKANAQAIADEQQQLITWLKSNANIFQL